MASHLDDVKKQTEEELARANLPSFTFAELEAKFNEVLLIEDKGIVKLLTGIYIGNFLNADPVWVLLSGASGGGKTEFIQSFKKCKSVLTISSLTPQTFASGMSGKKDVSLLTNLGKEPWVFTFKDFTTILQMNKDGQKEIMSQLREIYDGNYKKIFGTGKNVDWKGKIGFIAGTTPIVDMTLAGFSSMGERFIQYRLEQPDRKEDTRRSMKNTNKMTQYREELQNAFAGYMKTVVYPENPPELPEEISEEIVGIANFVTLARSPVIRGFDTKNEIVYKPESEMPTRMANQLRTILQSFMVINGGEILDIDKKIIHKIAFDSISQTRRIVLRGLARFNPNEIETAELATLLGYPTETIKKYVEDLAMLGVVKRIKQGKGKADLWSLEDEWQKIMIQYDGIESFSREEQLRIETEEILQAESTREEIP